MEGEYDSNAAGPSKPLPSHPSYTSSGQPPLRSSDALGPSSGDSGDGNAFIFLVLSKRDYQETYTRLTDTYWTLAKKQDALRKELEYLDKTLSNAIATLVSTMSFPSNLRGLIAFV